jgi:hypothetical protein
LNDGTMQSAIMPAVTLDIPMPEGAAVPKREQQELVKQAADEVALTVELKRLDIKKDTAYKCGQSAKARGFGRISPYYEDEAADRAFFAGFDGQLKPTLDELLAPVLG